MAIAPPGTVGLSGAIVWQLATPRGALALRRWPEGIPDPVRLRFIHDVVWHATRRGCRVLAPPLATRDGATFVARDGHLWELSPWLAGEADFRRRPSTARLHAALHVLAAFHRTVDDLPLEGRLLRPAPSIVERAAWLDRLLRGGWSELRRAVRFHRWAAFAPLAEALFAPLERLLPEVAGRVAALRELPLRQHPVLRDIWHDHVLYTNDEVTGLIDYGALRVDWPVLDVIRLTGSLVEDDPAGWREAIAAYTSQCPLTDDERQLLPAIDASGVVLAVVQWLEWLFVDELHFADAEAVARRWQAASRRLQNLARGLAWHAPGSGGILRAGSAD